MDLLTDQVGALELPDLAGLDLSSSVRPWSVARLERIMREAAVHPSTATLQAARQARHCLSVFWLAAPSDQLHDLYDGAIGDLHRLQLDGPLVQQPLAKDEQRWFDQLLQQLTSPEHKPRQHNLLLAAIPYTRPGQFSVGNPLEKLPDWLLADYAAYCDPALQAQLQEPVGLLGPAVDAVVPSLDDLLPLADDRGDAAMAWFRDDQAVERMDDLIRRYDINPKDQDVREELSGLRCVVAQLWLDIDADQGQSLYTSSVGAVTRALIHANFGQDLVDAQDQRIRAALDKPRFGRSLDGDAALLPPGSGQLECQQHAPGLAGEGFRHAPINGWAVALGFGPRSAS